MSDRWRRVPRVIAITAIAGAIASAFSCSKSQVQPTQPTPAPASCTFSVTADKTSFGAAGGSGNATVTTGSGCAWSASSQTEWLKVGSDSHTGNGTVAFTVSSSDQTESRTATLTVASQGVSISQEAAAGPPRPTCTYAVTASPDDFERDGGNGMLAIATTAGCKWSIKSDAPWTAIEGPSQGEGPASIKFSVAGNDDAPPRAASIAVADVKAVVTQPGQGDCTYSVSPVERLVPRFPLTGEIAITTGRGCAWTTSSDVSWMHVRQVNGHGSARVAYEADFNPQTGYGDQRTSVLAFRWLAPTAGQNVRVRQSGDCNTAVYAANGGIAPGATYVRDSNGGTLTATAAGGTFHLIVQTEPFTGCAWTLQSTADWVAISSPSINAIMPGDGDLHFTLPANPSSGSRGAALIMDGKALRIFQPGR